MPLSLKGWICWCWVAPPNVMGSVRPSGPGLSSSLAGSCAGLFVAAFDTRYRMPRWKSSSAALAIAGELRSTKEKKIAGICGGLGEYFDVDSNPIRLGLILPALVNVILPVLATSVIRR